MFGEKNNNLQKYRVWKGLTQEQLSKAAGVSLNVIRDIEIYDKLPKYTLRAKLCRYFGISHNQLFNDN